MNALAEFAPPFVLEPGRDLVEELGGPRKVQARIAYCDCFWREPDPAPGATIKGLELKQVTMGGEVVYVPNAFCSDGDDLSNVSDEFHERFRVYELARSTVVELLGIGTARVMPSWCAEANWSGITLEKEQLVLVNLRAIYTRGQMEDVILHEMAHGIVGAAKGHTPIWWTKYSELHCALTDAKYGAPTAVDTSSSSATLR